MYTRHVYPYFTCVSAWPLLDLFVALHRSGRASDGLQALGVDTMGCTRENTSTCKFQARHGPTMPPDLPRRGPREPKMASRCGVTADELFIGHRKAQTCQLWIFLTRSPDIDTLQEKKRLDSLFGSTS
jgi:hypothetical protein